MHHIGKYIGIISTLVLLGGQIASGQNVSITPSNKPLDRAPQPPPGAPVAAGPREGAEPGPSPRLARPPGTQINENLTEEQRTKLREANEKLRNDQQPLYTKMRDIRREMAELEKEDSLDEAKIREKAKDLATVEGDRSIIRAKHYHSIKSHLPKEQLDRFREGAPGARFAPGSTGAVVNPVPGAIRSGIPNRFNAPAEAPQPVQGSPERKALPPKP